MSDPGLPHAHTLSNSAQPPEPPAAAPYGGKPVPYRGVGLIPGAGAARTWGLTVIAVPLLLIVVLGLVGAGSGGSGSGAGAGSPWSGGTTTGDDDGTRSGSLLPSWTPPSAEVQDTYGDPDTATADPATDTPGSLFGDPSAPDPGTTTDASTDTDTGTATPADDPRAVVAAYFDAINNRDWPTAWRLGGQNLDSDYDTFVRGYATTEHDTVSVVSVEPAAAGQVVRLTLDATQTDGTTQSYDAAYTVSDGVIVSGTATPAG
ncbi:hypothetical protein SAMN05216251_102503 [Actinacidiphila alni]|uniref:Uncharacterized protein n=1 Tax=Actinacidiphila alni TaxID=380248 RepID=A0A1I1ZMZ8_9ACTN|nr:hypothetical protein [Actinacidiphila alni]SFE32728.1 hypothetical protein SAMN05216251_102503 [Actinacidiphila alni]